MDIVSVFFARFMLENMSIFKVGPSLIDVINLPPGKLVWYMAGATTVAFVYNIAVTQALRWSRRRLGKGSEFEICSEKSHPRLLASSLLQAALLFCGGFLFEYLYTKSAVLPTTVSGIVWAMRRCVGLPGKAPYGGVVRWRPRRQRACHHMCT